MQKADLGASTIEEPELQSLQHLTNNEPTNTETAKKIISRYQAKVSELTKAMAKQKKSNDQLKEELKQLNDTLNNLVAKIAVKPKQEKEDNVKEEVTKKELENQMKKTAALRRQLETLKAKMKVYEVQGVGNLQDQIKEKDKIIEDLHSNIKLHERIEKKQMNSDIYRKEQEAQQKIKSLTEELLHLKKKALDQKKAQQIQQKSMKFQQSRLIDLQTKQKSLPKNNQSVDAPKQTYKLLQQQNQRLKQNLQASQHTRRNIDKTFKAELDSHKNKIKSLQKIINDLKEQLTRKDKQITSLTIKLKSIDKSLSSDNVESKPQDLWVWSTLMQECRRQLKGLVNIKSSSRKFDDTALLPTDRQFRISKITIKYFQQHILELKTQYQILGNDKNDKKIQIITSFTIQSQYNNVREVSLNLSDYQYIKELQIYCGKCIELIKIRTSKQQVLDVGNQRNSLKCKRYVFDIKNYQKPIAFFGVLQNKNIADREREVLINLGLILKRKNIFGKRSKSLLKLQTKTASLLLPRANDKNIIHE